MMYFVWFSMLRILIAFNMAFKDVISSDVLVAVFFTLIVTSTFINIRYRILDSWFKQIANMVLEIVLLGLAISINVTEWLDLNQS